MSEHDLEEQLRRARIEDMLVSVLFSVSSLGFRRLGATPETVEERDLGQVKLAIDTMDALTGVLEPVAPTQLVSNLRSSAAGLKLAYVQAATAAPEAAEPEAAEPEVAEPEAAEPDVAEPAGADPSDASESPDPPDDAADR